MELKSFLVELLILNFCFTNKLPNQSLGELKGVL